MEDALFMGCPQRRGRLQRQRAHVSLWQRPMTADVFLKSQPLEIVHHQIRARPIRGVRIAVVLQADDAGVADLLQDHRLLKHRGDLAVQTLGASAP